MKDIIKNIYKIYSTISTGIEINSKKIIKNSIFIALKGTNFDGNDFALEAIENGAMLSIVDNKKYLYSKNKKILFVSSTLDFLQKLAIYHRKKNHHIPIIAITGSNGKTTTRELIKIILYKKYKNIHSTKQNYNNHIGVPLTILSMPKNTKMSIVEIGSNHEGEIDKMCSIIDPDYGYITNFGKSHLKGFKSFKGIIRGKLELYKFLEKKKKLVFINGDDPIQLFHSEKMKRFIFSIKKKILNQISNLYIFLKKMIFELCYLSKILKSHLLL
ncbi:UDP-N-acetylmuramoyl-tripeptide--D-alanyl-D-alanine ligase [Blattabacterium cuenoti]|uniref:UDP-N-acetylmuramoyl-tripeptide--D-alanyl-D- alanine ligase n=1 Tax=Blattabacterium cuenoti TaxID=1653831 RepID=UPI001EEA9D1B|nr:UDP-N-acetylmuramoyl-tripeptide--D-alanyl-D-alanine ligase [Blattabacterium cuenoti]